MSEQREVLNRFLVEVFHELLKTEEDCMGRVYPDLSLREMHVIEAVCRAVDAGRDNRATAIAEALRVTAGTLTTAVTQLEKKGCLLRQRDSRDKRVVRLLPTDRGRAVDAYHARFHHELVESLLSHLSEEETAVFVRGLSRVNAFFQEKYTKQQAKPAGKPARTVERKDSDGSDCDRQYQ